MEQKGYYYTSTILGVPYYIYSITDPKNHILITKNHILINKALILLGNVKPYILKPKPFLESLEQKGTTGKPGH